MVALVTSLGVIAVLAGLVALLFGIPINEFGLGNTLILAGTTAASAGFIVLALAAVLRAILQIGGEAIVSEEPEEMPAERRAAASEWPRPAPIAAARAESQARERAEPPSAARPPWLGGREETPRDEPRAPPPRAAPPLRGERSPPPTARPPLRAERAERPVEPPAPRASFQAPEPPPAEEPMAPAPEFGRDAGIEHPPQPERRRFFAWTRRNSGREAAEPTSEPRAEPSLGEGAPRFEPPRRTGRGEPRVDQPELARVPAERPPPPQAEDGSADQVEVLKSGTVGGMAYTLYTDGSIDAEFVEGKIRFASIDELRQHLEERG
jgi:hypothetical protein